MRTLRRTGLPLIRKLIGRVPDAEERERLRSLLGPDIKAKTIQIWFQNRRSKSRTKERQAAAKRALDGNEDDASGSGGDSKSEGQLDRESTTGAQDLEGSRLATLRQLIRDGKFLPLVYQCNPDGPG